MSNELYTYKFLNDSSALVEYKNAFDANGSPKKLEVLEWIHFKNTVKDSFTCLTYSEQNKLIAIYATMPVYFQINGEKIKGCQSLDTLTDSEYRGKGLFTKSAQVIFDAAPNEKYGLVYGFPNGNSVHGFTKKLGWTLIDPVPFLFKAFRTGYFLRKIFGNNLGRILDFNLYRKRKIYLEPDEEIREIEFFSEEATKLWDIFSKKIKVAVCRNATYLNWRFKEKPQENYQIKGFYKRGRLLGMIVYVIKNKHQGKIGYIMELIIHPSSYQAGKKLLNDSHNYFIENKADACLAWCMNHSPSYRTFKKNGFKILPEKLRPIELHLGYRNFAVNEDILNNRDNWYISYSDSDTV